MVFSKTEKIIVGIAYVIFMLLFFFIGIPKAGFLTYVIGFLVLTGIFAAVVWVVKTKLLGD